MPSTELKMFSYADNFCIVAQNKKLENIEKTPTSNLSWLEQFFHKWRLRPIQSKTMITTFHRNNMEANKEILVYFCGDKIKKEKAPLYLGITLDQMLTFITHLHKLSAKLKIRIGLTNKFGGTTWGAATSVLRTFSLAPVYSTAEYCTPV